MGIIAMYIKLGSPAWLRPFTEVCSQSSGPTGEGIDQGGLTDYPRNYLCFQVQLSECINKHLSLVARQP